MDEDFQEDFFGGDDFDDLPPKTLDELEERARVSTQQQRREDLALNDSNQRQNGVVSNIRRNVGNTRTNQQSSSDYGFDNDDIVIDLDAQAPFAQKVAEQGKTNKVDEVTQREQWRQQRYAEPSRLVHQRNNTEQVSAVDRNGDVSERATSNAHEGQDDNMILDGERGKQNGIDVSALQARIIELEKQVTNLGKVADDAKSTTMSKTGEIAIVRANQQRDNKEFERKMKTLQQKHSEELARSKAELEAMRKDREKFETNNKFLEYDLARESENARNARRTLKEGMGNSVRKASPFSTPRKNRSLPLRDGFDDGEVIMISPSKVKDRSKGPATPKAGNKRKRPQQEEIEKAESPAMSVSGIEHREQEENLANTPVGAIDRVSSPSRHITDSAWRFVQQILDYRLEDDSRCLEQLTRFHLTSNPEITLSSLVYDKLIQDGSAQSDSDVRLGLCSLLADLWEQSLKDKWYEPLYNLTELLQYILVISPSSLATSLISRMTPLCQQSIDLISVPTIEFYRNINSDQKLPTRKLKQMIRTVDYLKILQILANNSFPKSVRSNTIASDLTNFWSHMEWEFTLYTMHGTQPIEQIRRMLDLLHSSILPSSFGPIFPDPAPQEKIETKIMDRIGLMLLETLVQQKPPPRKNHFSDFLRKKTEEELDEETERNVPPYDLHEVLELRSSVISLLFALTMSDHGGKLVATHKNVIARVVRFLHESVVRMYKTYDGEDGDDEAAGDEGLDLNEEAFSEQGNIDRGVFDISPRRQSTHSFHIAHVNTSVKILYHLSSTYGNLSNSQSEDPNNGGAAHEPMLNIAHFLRSHASASQRFLIALSRIALSEQWGAEAGIEPDVIDMAHELLDDTISSEEGDGVMSVFDSRTVSNA